MKATQVTWLTLPLVILSAACSVRQAHVVNEPPVIETGVVKFEKNYGKVTMGDPNNPGLPGASFFFAPQGMSEEAAQEYFRNVNTASGVWDYIRSSIVEIDQRMKPLRQQFAALRCIEDFADQTDIGPDDEFETVTKWKVIASEDAKYATLQQCVLNQATREKLLKQRILLTDKTGEALGNLEKAVGKANSQSISDQGTTISILPSNEGRPVVEVTLADFYRKGNTQSTEMEGPGKIQNASYDVERKLLRFDVPELDAQGNSTGAVFIFALERAPDFLGMARFSGDANLVKDGVVLQHGIAKFEGLLDAN
jgi:hypothetical protein